MSTIASPRPSITLSSRRTSIETTTSNASKPTVDRGSLRRNRAALRDYYNLKKDTSTSPSPPSPTLDPDQDSELDKPGFDPDNYIQHLLATSNLEGVLKIEAGLVSDIRSLDGEKKALVYDNYSKLITATDTIRSMREKMDPLTPTTSTLTPAIGHIAETAGSLTRELRAADVGDVRGKQAQRKRQQEVVRWVLGAPERIGRLKEEGKEHEARQEWGKVSGLLAKWEGVKGAEEVRQACLDVLGEDEAG